MSYSLRSLQVYVDGDYILTPLSNVLQADGLPNLTDLCIRQTGNFFDHNLLPTYERLRSACDRRRCTLCCALHLAVMSSEEDELLHDLLTLLRESIIELHLSFSVPSAASVQLTFSKTAVAPSRRELFR